MIEIRKREKESTGGMLRRFSKKVRQSGTLLTARKNRFYEKPKNKQQQKVTALRREKLRALRRKLLKRGELQQGEKIDLSKIRER